MRRSTIALWSLLALCAVPVGCSRTASMTPAERAAYLARYAEWEEAIEVCNQVLAEEPENADVLLVRASAYAGTGKYQKAVDDLTEVIRLLPDDPEAYHRRAIAYSRLGKDDLAMADRRHARKIDSAAKTAFANTPPILAPLSSSVPVDTAEDGQSAEDTDSAIARREALRMRHKLGARNALATDPTQNDLGLNDLGLDDFDRDEPLRDEEAQEPRKSDAQRVAELLRQQNASVNAALSAELGEGSGGAGLPGRTAAGSAGELYGSDSGRAADEIPPAPAWQLTNPALPTTTYSFGAYGNIGVAPASPVTTGINSLRAIGAGSGTAMSSQAAAPTWGPLAGLYSGTTAPATTPTTGISAQPSGGTDSLPYTTPGTTIGEMTPGRYYPGPVYVPTPRATYPSVPSAATDQEDSHANEPGSRRVSPGQPSRTLPSSGLPYSRLPLYGPPRTGFSNAGTASTGIHGTGVPGTGVPGNIMGITSEGVRRAELPSTALRP